MADAPRRATRKAQILALHQAGIRDVEDLAVLSGARPSYVARVLREADLPAPYFDLYTSTGAPMNVYAKHFAGKLGYRDVATARRSVALIDRLYDAFERVADRAGQHHALVMALTLYNRARWTGKAAEADVFRRWLVERLGPADLTDN